MLLGIVDVGVGQVGQFGHLFADIVRRVELLALAQRRHDPHEHVAVDARPATHCQLVALVP